MNIQVEPRTLSGTAANPKLEQEQKSANDMPASTLSEQRSVPVCKSFLQSGTFQWQPHCRENRFHNDNSPQWHGQGYVRSLKSSVRQCQIHPLLF